MKTRGKTLWLVGAILLLAAFLRLYGIDYGLPHRYLHDEDVEVVRALRLGAWQYNWSFDRAQRGGYFYILFFEYCVYFLGMLAAGKVHGAGDFARCFAEDPTPFFLMGRVTTALFGTATVGVLYLFGRRFAGRTACVAASFFLAVAFLHVMESHAINLDVPLTFFTLLSFYFMTRITEEGTARDYSLAGFCATVAALHKIYMVLLILPFLGAHLWRTRRRPPPASVNDVLTDRKLLFTVAGCALFYLVANPGIVVNLGELIERIRIFYGSSPVPDALAINYAGPEISGVFFYLQSIVRSFGVGVSLLGLGGMGILLVSRDRRPWIFLLFFFLLFAIFASTRGMYSDRYLLPIFPLFALYAGILFSRILETLTQRKALIVLAAFLLGLQPLVKSLAEDVRYTRPDTRTLAREWFESHVPDGSRVLIHGLRTFPNICSVPLKPSVESVEDSIARHYGGGEGGKADLIRKYLTPSLGDRTYYLVLTGDHLERRTYADYLGRGIQYAVVCECEDDLYLSPRGQKEFPEIADIYRKLADPSHARLLKRFVRGESRFGPEIRIYEIRAAETGDPAASVESPGEVEPNGGIVDLEPTA